MAAIVMRNSLLIALACGCTATTSATVHGGGASLQDSSARTDGSSYDGATAGDAGASDEGALVAPDSPVMGSWINATSNLANMDSECGNVMSVSAKPDEDMLIAGIALKGLWASRDGGKAWTALGMGSGSAVINNRPSDIKFDPQVSSRWWAAGSYGSLGGVYRTDDNGNTLTQLGNVFHVDVVTLDFSDPGRNLLLAGAHEKPQSLYRSTDGGATWSDIGAALPANTECPHPLVIDSQTYLVGCNKTPSGVWRTKDGAATWIQVSASGGNFAPLRASDGSLYWASVDGTLTRSTNDGQNWTDMVGPGVVSWVRPTELPGGRLATLGQDRVVISSDHGATWEPVTPQLQHADGNGWFGIVYSSYQKAFFVWHFTCGNGSVPVPADGIMRFNFDYQTQ